MLLVFVLSATAVLVGATSSQRITRQAAGNTDVFQTEPRRAVVEPGGSITLLAKTGNPLQRCHFYLPGPRGRFVDFSQGAASESNDQYEYYGQGLASGECGIRMKRVDEEDDGIVECKVRPVGTHKWESCVSTLRVTDVPQSELPVFNIVPRTATLARGDNITITCNTDHSINMCHIYLPGPRYLNMDRGSASKSTNEYRYHGDGLEAGHCGVTLTGVDERLTGYVVCKLGHWPEQVTGAWETDALKVTTTRQISVPNRFPSSSETPAATTSVTNPPSSSERPVDVPTTDTSCTPLASISLIIDCTFAGDPTDCSERQPIGSIARLTCKPGYTKPETVSYKRVVCKRNGQWDHTLFTCTAECGKRKTNKGHELVSGGQDVQVGEFPWHIGMYEGREGTWKQMCGGSLITPRIVVSAAHCFWSGGLSKKKDASLYKMVAGKHSREWEDVNPRIQIRDIQEIILPSLFRGRDTSFASDIALLTIATPFELTESISLVCFDWDSALERSQLKVGKHGVVTGWGYTEEGQQSNVLRYVNLPYVPTDTCLDALSRDLRPLLTHDKMCAGFVNQNISVCRGDSGGGLVFQHPETSKYFLRGVASVAFTPAIQKETLCYAQLYTGFTMISQHKEFVKDNL